METLYPETKELIQGISEKLRPVYPRRGSDKLNAIGLQKSFLHAFG
jgi:hypothetical protein